MRALNGALALALLPCLASSSMAKRLPSKPVSPVVSDGIRYTAEGNGADQYLVATDLASGKELWRVKVFHNRIWFWVEPCVQIVDISDLKLEKGSVLVKDERSRCYSVVLAKRRVHKCDCGAHFSQ